MRLSPFDDTDTRSDQTDWLELSLLWGELPEVSSATMVRMIGLIEDEPEHGDLYDEVAGENVDEEILEPKNEQLLAEIWAEVEYRSNSLGEAYPFSLTAIGEGFVLSRRSSDSPGVVSAHRSYLACLLIAAARRAVVQRAAPGDELSKITRDSARVMQIIAVKSVAHFLAGDAYWFGWPRIDKSKSYFSALERLVELLGHGKLKREVPGWASHAEKDGTVDVVGWRSFPDRRYGSLIVYGQVASGKNWRSKPIKSYIHGFFHDWFEDDPAYHWMPAMFIPFNLHAEATDKHPHSLVQVAIDMARREERTYGIVFDRLRISALNMVDEATSCASAAEHMRDHASLVQEIDDWIGSLSAYARQDD